MFLNWEDFMNATFSTSLNQGSCVIVVHRQDTIAFLAVRGFKLFEVSTISQASKFTLDSIFIRVLKDRCKEYMYFLQKNGVCVSFETLSLKGTEPDVSLLGLEENLSLPLVNKMFKAYIESFVEESTVELDAPECCVISVCKPDSTLSYLAVVGGFFCRSTYYWSG